MYVTLQVQKAGALGAIIIDNVPGTSAATSPMFSMSGDGTNDVTIPAVFLFTQEASKLLLALSKDPTIQVTLSEYKKESEAQEEQSVFQKLKISVQEFINKHAGIDFATTVKVGGFTGLIRTDKVTIMHSEVEEKEIPSEKTTNQQWSQIRKGLLHSILHSETKQLFVPLNILRIYYQTLSNDAPEELAKHDAVKQTKWLLNELNVEYHRKQHASDDLIELQEAVSESQLDDVQNNARKLKRIHSMLDSISQIHQNLGKISNDDLFVSENRGDSDKVILTKEQLEASESNEKQLKNRATDEL